jgi:hypothetical protein
MEIYLPDYWLKPSKYCKNNNETYKRDNSYIMQDKFKQEL